VSQLGLFAAPAPEHPALVRKPWGTFSRCEQHGSTCGEEFCTGRPYRYFLAVPTGATSSRVALGIFANPSTATPADLDPTVTRWVNYCRDWGFGWAWVANARAWRETDPKKVPTDPEAIGPENDVHLRHFIALAEIVVCGWRNLAGPRGPLVLDMVREAGKVPHALKLNADGSPTHPGRLAASLTPFPMPEAH
jgi:hypothetical protein